MSDLSTVFACQDELLHGVVDKLRSALKQNISHYKQMQNFMDFSKDNIQILEQHIIKGMCCLSPTLLGIWDSEIFPGPPGYVFSTTGPGTALGSVPFGTYNLQEMSKLDA